MQTGYALVRAEAEGGPGCARLPRGGGGVWERDYGRPSPSHVIQERGRDGLLVLTCQSRVARPYLPVTWFSNTCNFWTMGTEQKQTVDVLNMKAYVLLTVFALVHCVDAVRAPQPLTDSELVCMHSNWLCGKHPTQAPKQCCMGAATQV